MIPEFPNDRILIHKKDSNLTLSMLYHKSMLEFHISDSQEGMQIRLNREEVVRMQEFLSQWLRNVG